MMPLSMAVCCPQLMAGGSCTSLPWAREALGQACCWCFPSGRVGPGLPPQSLTCLVLLQRPAPGTPEPGSEPQDWQ